MGGWEGSGRHYAEPQNSGEVDTSRSCEVRCCHEAPGLVEVCCVLTLQCRLVSRPGDSPVLYFSMANSRLYHEKSLQGMEIDEEVSNTGTHVCQKM